MALIDRGRRRSAGIDAAPFVNRISELEYLARGLERHRDRMVAGEITGDVLHHVLVFHGMTGVGKSTLSARLERWLRGGLPEDDEWGPRPDLGRLVTCRWDLNDADGSLDPLQLLITLRQAVQPVRRRWQAFDLALAALFQAVRPGEDLSFDRRNPDDVTDVVGILAGIAQDVGQSGLVTSFSASVVRRLVRAVSASVARAEVLADHPGLVDVLDRCLELSPGQQDAEVAGDIAWLLTEEIDRLAPADRPFLVVFVDHLERLQVDDRRDGERLLNRMAALLPFAVFVVTGRNRLDWSDARRSDLDVAGPTRWPGLDRDADDEPRQHLVGNLSPDDTRWLLEDLRDRLTLPIDDELLHELLVCTAGWPVHIEAVVTLAARLTEAGRLPLRAEHLVDSLPGLVRRLLEDLPDDEVAAFRAACVLPYFDVELAATIGGVDHGTAERCVARPIVENNPGSPYPYRVHDEIRRLVRTSGSTVRGGWAAVDWRAAATRGLALAQRRHDEARDAEDDRGMLAAHALGINLGLEHGVYDPWITKAFRVSPSHARLAALLRRGGVGSDPDALDVVRVVQALAAGATGDREATLATLRSVFERGGAMASSAGLWRCYRLRSWGRFDAALDQIDEVVGRCDDRPGMYLRQRVITLATARRFVDADARLDEVPHERQAPTRRYLRRMLGDLDGEVERLRARLDEPIANRRYRLELEGTELRVRARAQGVDRAEADALADRAVDLGHRAAECDALVASGYLDLFDDVRLLQKVARLDAVGGQVSPIGRPWAAELLALRALATGSAGHLASVRERVADVTVRRSDWIFAEVVLEHLGVDLPPVATQWLDPEAVVRERWLRVAEGIVARARA